MLKGARDEGMTGAFANSACKGAIPQSKIIITSHPQLLKSNVSGASEGDVSSQIGRA